MPNANSGYLLVTLFIRCHDCWWLYFLLHIFYNFYNEHICIIRQKSQETSMFFWSFIHPINTCWAPAVSQAPSRLLGRVPHPRERSALVDSPLGLPSLSPAVTAGVKPEGGESLQCLLAQREPRPSTIARFYRPKNQAWSLGVFWLSEIKARNRQLSKMLLPCYRKSKSPQALLFPWESSPPGEVEGHG